MKKELQIILILLTILFFVSIFGTIVIRSLSWKYRFGTVKPGEVWVKDYNQGNPFEPAEIDSLYILEVKDIWCKYRVVAYRDSVKKYETIKSDRIPWIRLTAEKVKNAK